MINAPYDMAMDDHNPLDFVEELANHKSWYFKRVNQNMITLQMAGQRSKFDINLEWQDEFCALQVACYLEMEIKPESRDVLADFLMQVNEDIWLGHFSLDRESAQPVFRYALLLEHIPSAVSIEMISDVVEAAVGESDRLYSTFKMLSNGSIYSHDLLDAAMMETVGEA